MDINEYPYIGYGITNIALTSQVLHVEKMDKPWRCLTLELER